MLRSFHAILPVTMVTLSAVAVMLAEAFRERNERLPFGALGSFGLLSAGVLTVLLWDRQSSSFDMVVADNFALFINGVLIAVGILTFMFSSREGEGWPPGEYYALILFAIAGMMLMAAATDLLLIFLALEILSLAVYVLTALRRSDPAGAEAGFKYFLLGSFSSAFFLYGVAFLYGLTGTTELSGIASRISVASREGSMQMLFGLGLILVGFGFKVSAVPFHMWTPDAYQGAPTLVTGFMSTGVKAAALASMTRVLLSALEPMRAEWLPLVWIITAATMMLGSVVAVAQTNVKRMLAYSSIAHGGYMLIALVAGTDVGKASILFYLLAYAFTNLGAFAVVAMVSRLGRGESLSDYQGLWHTHPVLAVAMTIFLLSLGGFPPTAGFVGKWYVFTAAIGSGLYGLAIIGVLTSVVSVFFYLRVIVMMYMTEPAVHGRSPWGLSRPAQAALALTVAAVLFLGILPTPVLQLAAASIATIF